MITSSSQAPFADQPRGDTKTRQPMPPPIPLEPVDSRASGETGRTPSGRSVAICIFSRTHSYETWRNRGSCERRITVGSMGVGIVSGAFTGILYRPADDDPDGSRNLGLAVVGALVAPFVLRCLAPLDMAYWHIADRWDQRSREATERIAVAELSPRARLARHVHQANEERRTASGVEKAIAFLKTLQEENPEVLSHDDVARSIAAYIGGAASVESPDSFSLLTYHLAELAAEGRCEPAFVLDQLETLWYRAKGALNALARDAPERSGQLRRELQHDVAAAITRTVWRPVDHRLGLNAREMVRSGWRTLDANAATIAPRLYFARSVIQLVPLAGNRRADTVKLMRALQALVVNGLRPQHGEGAPASLGPAPQPAGRHVGFHASGNIPGVPGRVIRLDPAATDAHRSHLAGPSAQTAWI